MSYPNTTTIYYDTQDPQNHGWAYRSLNESGPIDSLYDLLTVLRRSGDDDEIIVYREDGGKTDMSELPTFGGTEPDDTNQVWSWDETRLLVGTCSDDFQIIARTCPVVCVYDGGNPASLQVGRTYTAISDLEAQAKGLIRVIDESGEDYLYRASWFELNAR